MGSDKTFQTGSSYQGEVSLERYKGEPAVVKSISHPSVPIVNRIEKWLLNREALALRRLRDVSGVPRFLGYPDENSIAMEYVEGETVRQADDERMDAEFFDNLWKLVNQIHDHGIVHSDLKKKDNILITPEDDPVIVDFGTTFRTDSRFGWVSQMFFEQFRQMDRNAVSKLKRRICPESMNQGDRNRLDNPILFERIDRFRRNYIYDW